MEFQGSKSEYQSQSKNKNDFPRFFCAEWRVEEIGIRRFINKNYLDPKIVLIAFGAVFVCASVFKL